MTRNVTIKRFKEIAESVNDNVIKEITYQEIKDSRQGGTFKIKIVIGMYLYIIRTSCYDPMYQVHYVSVVRGIIMELNKTITVKIIREG